MKKCLPHIWLNLCIIFLTFDFQPTNSCEYWQTAKLQPYTWGNLVAIKNAGGEITLAFCRRLVRELKNESKRNAFLRLCLDDLEEGGQLTKQTIKSIMKRLKVLFIIIGTNQGSLLLKVTTVICMAELTYAKVQHDNHI